MPLDGPVQAAGKVYNSYAGWPSASGAAVWLRLLVTMTGELDRDSQYLVDIQAIDKWVREHAIGHINPKSLTEGPVLLRLFRRILLKLETPNAKLYKITLQFSPFQSWTLINTPQEWAMVRVSQSFEFSAAHRLHNPALSDEENRRIFGKCNNALGHGHNYKVQVTVREAPDEVISLPEMERIVDENVIRPFDHKHLNLEVADFKETLASVENIAAAAFRRLKGVLPGLASVTVWETEKTWAEYSDQP